MYTQKQKQLTAHERITVHEIFGHTMNFLEKYIEIAGYYSDWEQKKQIRNNEITRTDIIGNPEKAEKAFSVVLFGLRQALEENPSPSLRDELREEFYRWISSAGINVQNCHPRLKQILYGFNEILEGRGEKIMEDVKNRKETTDINAPDYAQRLNNVFAGAQTYLVEGREREKSLKGKKGNEVEITNRFSGSSEQGEKIFGQISKTVSSNDFHYFKQKDQQIRNPNYNPLTDDPSEEFLSSSSMVGSSKQEIDELQQARRFLVNDIKQHANEFEFQIVLTSNGHYYDAVNKKWVKYGEERKETMLLHKSVKITENDYNEFGYLNVKDDKMFRENRFNREEWVEIQQSLKSSQSNQKASSDLSNQKPPKGGRGGGMGGYGSSVAFGSLGIISLIGLAFTR